MRINNSTNLDGAMLRDITHHSVREWKRVLKWRKNRKPFRVGDIKLATFRNRRCSYSGRAYYGERRFVVSVGLNSWHCSEGCDRCQTHGHTVYTPKPEAERIRIAAWITAHEVGHLAVHHAEEYHGRPWTRDGGKSSGGDEEYIDRLAKKFAATWMAKN